jgi:hypothetical protein
MNAPLRDMDGFDELAVKVGIAAWPRSPEVRAKMMSKVRDNEFFTRAKDLYRGNASDKVVGRFLAAAVSQVMGK